MLQFATLRFRSLAIFQQGGIVFIGFIVLACELRRMSRAIQRVEAAGITEVILYFNFGAYSHTNTRRMMERFAREVMPHFTAPPVAVSV